MLLRPWLASACVLVGGAAYEFQRVAIVSSPEDKKIYYQVLPTFSELLKPANERPKRTPKVLINGVKTTCPKQPCPPDPGVDVGLQAPSGLALYETPSGDRILFVADPVASCIYAYEITVGYTGTFLSGDLTLTAGPQKEIQRHTQGASWVAVDGWGSMYFTVPGAQSGGGGGGKVSKVSYTSLARWFGRGLSTTEEANATVLAESAMVDSPEGVAVDGFYVYWANGQDGSSSAGTVVQGLPDIHKGAVFSQGFPKKIAQNTDAAYGVCVARDYVFYTGASQSLFSVKRTGGAIAEVTKAFQKPRGCAYDGQSTLLVADEASDGGAVFSMPGNIQTLRTVNSMDKVIEVNKPFGVAAFIVGGAARPAALVVAFAVAVLQTVAQ